MVIKSLNSALKSFAATPENFVAVASDGTTSGIPPVVESFISSLAVLEGVPFNYLVPDARMLPNESLRFFYLDPNWIGALSSGACSIGSTSTFDQAQDQAIVSYIQQVVTEGIGNDGPYQTGMLMRSALVADMPGLQIVATDQGGNALSTARFATLSNNVLLVLFNGVAAEIAITEPPQGIQFGCEVAVAESGSITAWHVDLRGLGTTTPLGELIETPTGTATYTLGASDWRSQNQRVINAASLASNIQAALTTLGEWPPPTQPGDQPLTVMNSDELAIEMIEGPQTVTMTIAAASSTDQAESSAPSSPPPGASPEDPPAPQPTKARRRQTARERVARARERLEAFLKGL